MKHEFDSETNTIFSIIRSSFFGEEFHPEKEVNYRRVYNEMMTQRIVQLLSYVLDVLPEDEKLKKRIANTSLGVSVHGAKAQALEVEVNHYLEEAGIPSVIFKGSVATLYYPKNMDRIYGDVDVLVEPENYERALKVLLEKGAVEDKESEKDPRNAVLYMNDIEVELHHHFFMGDLSNWNENILGGFKNRVKMKNAAGEIYIFPELENGIIYLQHFRQHIVGGIGLRQVLDWMAYVNAVCDDAFWNEKLAPIAGGLHLVEMGKALTKICKMYLGLPDRITWCDDVPDDVVNELLQFIMKSGNFGHKTHMRDDIILNILSEKRTIPEWFKFLQHQGLYNMPENRRNKFTEKFAWAYQAGRYVKRGISGNRIGKFLFSSQRKEAKAKQGLFEKLDL